MGSLTFSTAPSLPQLPFHLKTVMIPSELLHMNLFPVAFGWDCLAPCRTHSWVISFVNATSVVLHLSGKGGAQLANRIGVIYQNRDRRIPILTSGHKYINKNSNVGNATMGRLWGNVWRVKNWWDMVQTNICFVVRWCGLECGSNIYLLN